MDEEDDPFMQQVARDPALRGRSKQPRDITNKELQTMLNVQTDASAVLLRIERQDGTFEQLLRNTRNNEQLKLTVKVIAKAVENSTSAQPQAVANVLTVFKDTEDFLDKIRFSLCQSSSKDEDYIRAILVIFKLTLQTYPNTAAKILAHVFMFLERFITDNFFDNVILRDELVKVQYMMMEPERQINQEEEEERRNVNVQNDRNVDPNLFRGLSIVPTARDFDPAEDIMYRANKVQGAYNNINDYLDIQFRLLRADLILPLRDNILKYLNGEDVRGIQVYSHVRIVRPICHDKGLCFRLSFDVTKHRKINWNVSQRLKYGSLLCLSTDNFNNYQFAVVENREAKDLAKGLVDVQFILNANGPEFQMGGHEDFMRLIGEGRDQRYVMVESPTYFEAYKYVLLGLQHFTENNFPFWRYIGTCQVQVDPPEYLQNRENPALYDLRPFVDTDFVIKDGQNEGAQFSEISQVAAAVNVLDVESWPSANTFSLDNSQFVALQSSLTKEFSIIQGPPGTGKTFIGLMVMKALLHNKHIWLGDRVRSPILLVCYTNHALDQFLEGILTFFRGALVRVGSRSKSERLEEYNLRGMRNRARENRAVPMEIHLAKQETRIKMKELKAEIHTEAAKLEILEREIVKESFLKCMMEKQHYDSLTKYAENCSVITRWLGISLDTDNLEKRNKKKKPKHLQEANQGQEQNGGRPEANNAGAVAAANPDENADDSDDDDEDDDIHLLENLNAELPQTRHLDVNDDEDDDVDSEEEDTLFTELMQDFGTDLIENIRNVNRKLDEADMEASIIRARNVAFNISEYGEESMPSNLSKEEKKHWKSLIPLKKRYRAILLTHLQNTDKMPEGEVGQIFNVWRLKRSDRWRLYRYWIDIYCRQIRGEIRDKSELYEEKARRYQEILHQEDKSILEGATIIGMTTTGAARYQGILREIGPKIVLVEEAAEVLEGHVITSLTDQCQHVVLIGDHKQLRPNPSVYKLKKDFGLDISLFERLINNGFRHDSLKYQHRMRPEISRLLRVRDLYPDLQDHDLVKNYPDVLRVKGNICFIQHSEHDQQECETSTFCNDYEARFIIGLCEYILLQGQFTPEKITILSPYAGQIHLIKNSFNSLAKSHKTEAKMKGVKISSVDNYQGEENDIILLSLVRSNEDNEIGFLKANNRICVALSRAKIGLYVIGNFAGLVKSSPLLQEIINEATRLGYYRDNIVLSCLRHKKKETIIRHPDDFKKVSEGGCSSLCEIRLMCGHSCKRICHADDFDHKKSECNERCGQVCEKCKQHCREEHRCGQHDVCRNLVEKRIPNCHHLQKVPCHLEPNQFECGDRCREVLPCGHPCRGRCGSRHAHTQDMCKAMIEITAESCGHTNFQVECGKARNMDRDRCPLPCGTELECGHMCEGTCGQCGNGRLHLDCKQKCQKLLICGHTCRGTCSSCPPCTLPCETECSHSRCAKKCGELCAACIEPCSWRCRHESCADLCCQPCERPPCDVQCPKRLPCDHICCGLCGEKCPRLCSICDKDTLVNESQYGYDGSDPTTTFIELDCGHVVEVEFMDQWMKTSTVAAAESSDESDVQTIGLKACPYCKSPVRKCARYNHQIKEMLRLIETVKRKYIGERDKDMKRRLEQAITGIRGAERHIIDAFIEQGNQVQSEVFLEAQLNQVNLFRLISDMRTSSEECQRRFVHRAETFRKILRDLDCFTTWTLRKRVIFTEQNKLDAELEKDRLHALLELHRIEETMTQRGIRETISSRHLVMLGQMTRALSAYKRGNLQVIEEGKNLVEELRLLVPDSHIALTAAEKLEIVRAVNVSKGAWYQCRNGHIYAIGDCGQAMEIGTCPECKEKIGGTNHALLSDNVQAPEMDNAERPIWDNLNADLELARQLQEEWNLMD